MCRDTINQHTDRSADKGTDVTPNNTVSLKKPLLNVSILLRCFPKVVLKNSQEPY